MASRLLKEIPEDCIVRKGISQPRPEPAWGSPSPGYSHTKPRQSWHSESSMLPKTGDASYLELNKGDMVLHGAFGKGMVLTVTKMGGDALLEIAFDDIGTKKLMAKAASAHMKKL